MHSRFRVPGRDREGAESDGTRNRASGCKETHGALHDDPCAAAAEASSSADEGKCVDPVAVSERGPGKAESVVQHTGRLDHSGFRPVVITPTYNNAPTLLNVLERIERVGLPVIAVNDGSTDDTHDKLSQWAARAHEVPVKIVAHEVNRGKAAALKNGFAHARTAGYTHAVTIDTDGQLDPDNIPGLLAAARSVPAALVLGTRKENSGGPPRSNLWGWFLSALGIWVETGVLLHDSQCGLRVYPLHAIEKLRCWTGRFGYETEVLTRAIWAGMTLLHVPVSCIYDPMGSQRSHLNPVRDGVKGFFMHWALAVRRLVPWPPTPVSPRPTAGNGNAHTGGAPGGSDVPDGQTGGDSPSLRDQTDRSVGVSTHSSSRADAFACSNRCTFSLWRNWLDPLVSWRLLTTGRLEQLVASASFAHGVFMACLPLGTWAFVAAAFGSFRLHHNLWAALAGACLVLSPAASVIAGASDAIGAFLIPFESADSVLTCNEAISYARPGPAPPLETGIMHVSATLPFASPVATGAVPLDAGGHGWADLIAPWLGGLVLGTFLHWLTIGALVALLRLVPVHGSGGGATVQKREA